MKPGTAALLVFPVAVLVAAIVLLATQRARAADPYAEGVWWDEDVARFVRDRLAKTYVDEVDDERASRAFYRAMDAYLREFDEYCDFIPPAEHRRRMDESEGQYAGLGVKVREEEDGLQVIGVLPDGPASRAGIRVGDTLAEADGNSLRRPESGALELTRLLKGAAKSRVRLVVVRGPRPAEGPANGAREEMTVVREVVRTPTVYPRRVGPDGAFAVIRLTDFAGTTAQDFDEALKEVLEKGARGVVLDLRHNGGGLLGSAVHVADRFLAKGTIVRMDGRAEGRREHSARVDARDVPDSIPVAVLVNSDSASASEVVAGALQDHRRALLVGERTYGKFLVQQMTEIAGKESAVTVTTARYYTPSGRSYQRRPGEDGAGGHDPRAEANEPAGLLPDVIVPLEEKDRLLLRQAFANEEGARWQQEKPFADVPAEWVDPQLQRAVEILEGELILRKIRR